MDEIILNIIFSVKAVVDQIKYKEEKNKLSMFLILNNFIVLSPSTP
jgi:hypothetical protein